MFTLLKCYDVKNITIKSIYLMLYDGSVREERKQRYKHKI
jgi:hypothetical protein